MSTPRFVRLSLLLFGGVLLVGGPFGASCGPPDDGPPHPVELTQRAFFVQAGGLPAETAPDATDRRIQALSRPGGATWYFRFDSTEVGEDEGWPALESVDASWTPMAVPAAWDLAHPQGFDRQDVGWYWTAFTADATGGDSARLRFDGVFREAKVWLNGVALGGTDLPYLPFAFDVTEVLRPGARNVLVVRVDNRITETSLPCDTVLQPGKHGWFPYGGILRPVWLERGLPVWPAQVLIRPRWTPGSTYGHVEAEVYFSHTGVLLPNVKVTTRVTNEEGEVFVWSPVVVPTQAPTAGDLPGLVYRVSLRDPAIFSPDHPEHVYRFELTVQTFDGATETTAYRFAFRTFEARDQRFFLNGEDFYLRGINRHEDHPTQGPVYDADVMARDLELMGLLGANFSRPGHYPNDVRGLRDFEDHGLLLVEEIPVYQWAQGQMANPEMIDRAQRALQTLILRDYNRPAIVMWSVANEIHSWADSAPDFVRGLYDTAKALDPVRPVMVAAVSAPAMSEMDQSSGLVDVVGINEYEGWYMETTSDVTGWLEILHGLYPDRTVFISEYGAGALLGRHLEGPPGEEPVDDHSYSEEYQAWFHEQHITQFLGLDFVRGFMPWVFADFRMQWTPTTGQPHPVENMNLKGLCSADRARKQAFATVRRHFEALANGE